MNFFQIGYRDALLKLGGVGMFEAGPGGEMTHAAPMIGGQAPPQAAAAAPGMFSRIGDWWKGMSKGKRTAVKGVGLLGAGLTAYNLLKGSGPKQQYSGYQG